MRKVSDEKTAGVSFVPGSAKAPRKMVYELSLLTPLFGGDTESWEPNPQRPIRESSVKGHLRFWWRTMQDAMPAAELKEKENAIFGSTGTASKVALTVKHTMVDVLGNVTVTPRNGVQANGRDLDYPAYVLFPLITKNDETRTCIKACDFTLTVSMSGLDAAQEESVSNAITLWILFGGVGARTRRGCGSLSCPEVTDQFENMESVKKWIKSLTMGQNPKKAPYPRLAGATLAHGKAQADPVAAWNSFLGEYGKIRQLRKDSRPRPGRSYWPEPDSIRRITGESASNHEPKHPAGNWFPRAAYGMPVQIEFRNATGDPGGKFFVQPEGKDRWASPLILKVIKLGGDNLVKACLVFNQSIPEDLELKRDKMHIHDLKNTEHPANYENRVTLSNDNENILTLKESPYRTLVRKLNLTEVK